MVIVNYNISNACGSDTAFKKINVSPIPEPPLINHNKFLLRAGTGFAAYQWSVNGSPISGAIYDSFIVINPGLYGVFVENSAGCRSKSDPVYCDGCSIGDLFIYPNPSSSKVTISWCKKIFVRLTTSDGRTVIPYTVNNEIDISNLPDAVYFLNILDENKMHIITKQIIKN
jgi:hypothetical protein